MLISQFCIAAIHIPPPVDTNPGSLLFENVLVDGSSNVRANLTATDNLAIHAGQVYVLPFVELGPPSGAEDATYHSLSQQIVSQNVMQTATLEYDITLNWTKFDLMTNSLEFTVTELRRKTLGGDNQLVEQVTTFMPGPQGEKGDQGEKGETGELGEQGPEGPVGVDGTIISDGSTSGELLSWNGSNWIAEAPTTIQSSSISHIQPSLAVNYIIALVGTFPSRNSISDPTIGEISMFAGNFAPRSWAFCDGQLLAISQYQALFSILGTTYGGDGRTTFALPDLRGRVTVHEGTGSSLTPRTLGARFGAESQTIDLHAH